MIAFNAWYYSFSPTVAAAITQHPALQYAMRAGLYPLIAILELGATPFGLFPTHSEFPAIISGLLIASLIGVAYVSLPVTALSWQFSKRRLASRKAQRTLAVVLALSLAGIFVAEVARLGPLMIVATVSSALSTLVFSTLLTSNLLLQLIERCKS